MLFFSKRFFPFFNTFFWGAFNDNMFRIALVILITYHSGLDEETASSLSFLAMALMMIPQFPFSAPAGEIADKYPQAKLFRIIKLSEAVLMLLTLAAFYFHNLYLLLGLLFLMGTQSAFYSPVKYAYVPRMLPDELVRGNAYVSAGTYLAILLGTVCGNLLIIQRNGSIWVGGLLVFCALAGYFAARFIPEVPAPAPERKVHVNIAGSTWKILAAIFCDRILRHCALGLSIFWMAGALYLSQLAGFCKDIIGANEVLVMIFTLLFSAGVAAGSCLCAFFRRFKGILGAVSPALVVMALFTADLYFASHSWIKPCPAGELANVFDLTGIPAFWRFVIDLAGLAICGGFYSVLLMTLLQKSAPPEQIASIVAGNNILNAAAIGTGTICVSQLIKFNLISVEGIFLLVAGVNLLAAVYLFTLRKCRLDN